jgi:hypothetical protein
MTSFAPFGAAHWVTVATTSTTSGADLLVSGVSDKENAAQIIKYQLVRPSRQATEVLIKPLGTVISTAGSAPHVLGGD